MNEFMLNQPVFGPGFDKLQGPTWSVPCEWQPATLFVEVSRAVRYITVNGGS